MQYKLIYKRNESQAYICFKVTVKSFDYYIETNSNEIGLNQFYYSAENNEIFFSRKEELSNKKQNDNWQKIIATNNPNIGLFQVVDEMSMIKELAEDTYGTEIESNRGSNPFDQEGDRKNGFIRGYTECLKINAYSKSDVIRFGEWLLLNVNDTDYYNVEDYLGVWKQEEIATIYYDI